MSIVSRMFESYKLYKPLKGRYYKNIFTENVANVYFS